MLGSIAQCQGQLYSIQDMNIAKVLVFYIFNHHHSKNTLLKKVCRRIHVKEKVYHNPWRVRILYKVLWKRFLKNTQAEDCVTLFYWVFFYYFCFPQSPRLLPMLCISHKKSEIAQITTTDGRNGWMMEIKGVGVCYVVLWVSSFVPKTWYSTMAMTLMSLCVCVCKRAPN